MRPPTIRHGRLRVQLGLVLAAAFLLALAGAAWACTPRPENFALDTMAAAGGEQVTASGSVPSTQPVALRWNGITGPVLATATPTTDGTFSTTFEVPENAESGVAYVIADVRDDSTGVARAALEITGGEQASATHTAWDVSPGDTMTHTAPIPGGLTAPLMAGAGLLTLGMAGLFAGATAAAVQQRRVPARVPGRGPA